MENQEQEELNILSGKGYEFETVFFGKITKWHTGKMTLGKMIKLSQVFIKINVDEKEIFNNDMSIQIPAQYKSVTDNAKICVEAVYIAIETEFPKWVRRFEFIYKPLIKKHLLNSLNSEELSKFAIHLLKNSDYKNFLSSTVLMNGNRPTKAMPIEETV